MTVANEYGPHVLYRIWGEETGRPLYVGITHEEWWHRMSNHARKQPWRHEIRGHTLEWFPTRSLVLAAEERAIKNERPKYNVVHNAAVRSGNVDPDNVRQELIDSFYAPRLEARDDWTCRYCSDEMCGDCCNQYAHDMRWTVEYIIRSFQCDKPVWELYPRFCTDCVSAAIHAGHAYYVGDPFDDSDYLHLPLDFVDGYKAETAEDWIRVRDARDAYRMRMQVVGGSLHGRVA